MVEGERVDGARVRTGKGVGVGSGQDWVKGLRGVRIMNLERMGEYI